MVSTPDISYGPFKLRIRKQDKGYAGIIVGQAKEVFIGETHDDVENQLREKAASQNKGFIGIKGARNRFLEIFQQGFEDEIYIGSGDYGERGYKLDLSQRIQSELPLNEIEKIPDIGETALRLFRAINLADPFTKTRLAEVMRGPKARRFLAIVASFAQGEIENSCRRLNAEFSDENVNTWVCLTFFPFFWKPKEHFFLKPEFTQEFAKSIGDDFQYEYESTLNAKTYSSLLRMADKVSKSISDLKPRDNIDIHSFMFATVNYTDADIANLKSIREQT